MTSEMERARAILRKGYGEKREEAEGSCFGDCCLSPAEKKALVTLIYAEEAE